MPLKYTLLSAEGGLALAPWATLSDTQMGQGGCKAVGEIS